MSTGIKNVNLRVKKSSLLFLRDSRLPAGGPAFHLGLGNGHALVCPVPQFCLRLSRARLGRKHCFSVYLTPSGYLLRRPKASSVVLPILLSLPKWLRGCGNAKTVWALGNSLAVSHKHSSALWTGISPSEGRCESIQGPVLNAHSSLSHHSPDHSQSKGSHRTDEQVWYIYTMEYHSAITMDKLQKCAGTWVSHNC